MADKVDFRMDKHKKYSKYVNFSLQKTEINFHSIQKN